MIAGIIITTTAISTTTIKIWKEYFHNNKVQFMQEEMWIYYSHWNKTYFYTQFTREYTRIKVGAA